jgi:hypothetical protein
VQNRVDCKTFFKANQIFFGCSYTSTSHGNYVLVDGMRRARIPTGDYIGVCVCSRRHRGVCVLVTTSGCVCWCVCTPPCKYLCAAASDVHPAVHAVLVPPLCCVLCVVCCVLQGLWVGCFGLMVIFAFCVGKCEWRAWAGDHPRHWLVGLRDCVGYCLFAGDAPPCNSLCANASVRGGGSSSVLRQRTTHF